MASLYRFLAENEPLVYILLALAALLAGRQVWRAWQEQKAAIFALERQISRRRLFTAAVQLAAVLALAMAELLLVSFVVPASGALDVIATPTVDLFASPSGAETPGAGAAAPSSALPDETGCTPGQVEITTPPNGAEISGQIVLEGTVDIPNFGFYKFEMSPLGTQQWVTILAGRQTVQSGELGRWDTSTLLPGDYALRLVVTDTQGQLFQPCTITVRVKTP